MYLTYPKASEHLAAMGVPLAENTLVRWSVRREFRF
jgi:hypothetical protein